MRVCPICKREYEAYPALSRRDNRTAICPDCGTAEALEAFGLTKPEAMEKVIAIEEEYLAKDWEIPGWEDDTAEDEDDPEEDDISMDEENE